jgi:lysophospholipase L1-like esterase
MKTKLVVAVALASLLSTNTLTSLVSRSAIAQEKQAAPSLAIPSTDDGLPGAGTIRRHEWFQKLWLDRRTKWAQEVSQKQGSLVFLGDSITQGWGDNFKDAFGATKVANRGISGDTTRGVLIRLEQDVLALHPSGVVLLIGTNDLEEKVEPTTIADNTQLILNKIKAHNPRLPIVICSVFPSSESKSRPASKIQEVNRLVQAKVKGDPQITVVDTYVLFADDKGDAKKSEFPDLLHPNAIGYKKWEDAIRPVLEVVGLIEPPRANFTLEPGFESLFNGKDLTGWGFHASTEQEKAAREKRLKADPNAVVGPIIESDKEFRGQRLSDDGRYVAVHERLVVTTPPEGRRIQQLWTTRDFKEDFVLKLEFRATPNADSGVFIRGKQLQCRDYALAGPYKQLANYRPQQWNELEIRVTGNVAKCTCNGELLEEAFALPANGPIGLEGDRGQMEYRNIRIQVKP